MTYKLRIHPQHLMQVFTNTIVTSRVLPTSIFQTSKFQVLHHNRHNHSLSQSSKNQSTSAQTLQEMYRYLKILPLSQEWKLIKLTRSKLKGRKLRRHQSNHERRRWRISKHYHLKRRPVSRLFHQFQTPLTRRNSSLRWLLISKLLKVLKSSLLWKKNKWNKQKLEWHTQDLRNTTNNLISSLSGHASGSWKSSINSSLMSSIRRGRPPLKRQTSNYGNKVFKLEDSMLPQNLIWTLSWWNLLS